MERKCRKVEQVQCSTARYVTLETTARFVLQKYHRCESVTSMLHNLNWKSLEWRRNAANLTMIYKIQHNLVAVNPALYLSPMAPRSTRSYLPTKFLYITSWQSHTTLWQFIFPEDDPPLELPPDSSPYSTICVTRGFQRRCS